jgi:succinoglycan biosynthesis transport protein ExoP
MSPYRPTSTYLTSYAPPAAAPGFQLTDFVGVLSARRNLILKVALAVIAAAVIVALMLPRQYTSSSVVMLESRKNNITDLSAVLAQLPTDPATLQNQIQIITSRDLAAEVITRLQLYNDPEFNPALTPPGPSGIFRLSFWLPPSGQGGGDTNTIHDRILGNFLRHISADANGLSTAITIYANASDPKKAQDIANAVAQAYVDSQVAQQKSADQGTSDWLDKRTNDLAQQLMLEQQAVQAYKARHGLNDSAPGNSLVDQQMAAINAQIVQAQSDLAEKQAAMERVGPSAAAGNADSVSQVISSPLITQLREQQADLARQDADLSSKYGPLHPKLQALQAQERDLNAKIQQEIGHIAGSLGNDVEAAKTHLASLQQSLAQVERQADGQNSARVELEALQSNADSTKAQYEAFVGRLRASEDQDTVAAPESRIISSATYPLSPSAPRRGLIVGASIPLALLLGVLAALLSEYAGYVMPVRVKKEPRPVTVKAKPVRTPRPARAAGPARAAKAAAPAEVKALPPVWNGPPILAELANAERLGAASYVVDYPASRYADAMSALVSQFDSHESGAAVVAVTSAQSGESKSAVAVSIARAAAQMGKKTVLIDCDPDQLAVKTMEAPAKAGLYEVLTGAVPLSQALAKDSRSGAYALAMTKRPPKLSTMFNSAAMERLLEVLKEGADLVVLDCSRAMVPEAGMLAKLGDATLLVTRKELLNKSALSRSVEALAGSAPLGIIATR